MTNFQCSSTYDLLPGSGAACAPEPGSFLYRNYLKYSRAIQKIIKLIVICVNPMIRMLFSTASQWGFPISCTFAQAT